MDLINKATPRYNVFNERWEFISDSVMGGISSGELKIINDENILYYKLLGRVSTANNGGFIQFRSKIKLNENYFSGLEIEYKNKGKNDNYFIHLTTSMTVFPWQYYKSKLQLNKEWSVIKVPLNSFKKSNFYQPRNFTSEQIKTVGFVAIGDDFDAELDIRRIKLYR